MKAVLTIAGSDCSGGAGVQADIKTMCAHGVYGMTAITAITAQNTLGVTGIEEVAPEFLKKQIDACLSDIPADAVKIGMISSKELLEVIADRIREYKVKNVVTDPVMISSSGKRLMSDSVGEFLPKILFPMSRVVTPNIPEAETLTGKEIATGEEMERAARELSERFGCAVLVKGGHKTGDSSDVLCEEGNLTWFMGEHIENSNTHGTGCTLSSAIACNLAMGKNLVTSIREAKNYITKAIGAGLDLGKGNGPLNHMV